jgi:uncharacterized protein (DUF2164 family)
MLCVNKKEAPFFFNFLSLILKTVWYSGGSRQAERQIPKAPQVQTETE